jgi:hypothetical protein
MGGSREAQGGRGLEPEKVWGIKIWVLGFRRGNGEKPRREGPGRIQPWGGSGLCFRFRRGNGENRGGGGRKDKVLGRLLQEGHGSQGQRYGSMQMQWHKAGGDGM